MINIYLDDERQTPEIFKRTYTAQETIKLLWENSGNVRILSLDHDLGDEAVAGNGYQVLTWLEERVFLNEMDPPEAIGVHSANSSARIKMLLAIDKIYEIYRSRKCEPSVPLVE